MRKRLRVMVGVVVAGMLAIPAVVIGVHVAHPRDEDRYLAYLKRWGDLESNKPLEVLPPTADLIAAGDAACDWLREQPYALWRHDPQYRELRIYQRYLDQLGGHPPRWGEALPNLGSVTSAAWTYLCPADRELREPRSNPFAPEPD
ncbi:hypothetical protein MRQ36_06815 [Micromonospora sp. R77]|uniref:hypothetical protein n=1 Tax=Micromonospora sp. R77 TaxID=2925836 RepID=UPI001F6116FD|nr:hypothetical protein [Micromonospora sp. R77]MCI4062287.1 hypothetical protein [Micromonospora sp. R77]